MAASAKSTERIAVLGIWHLQQVRGDLIKGQVSAHMLQVVGKLSGTAGTTVRWRLLCVAVAVMLGGWQRWLLLWDGGGLGLSGLQGLLEEGR